ncbi:hypothetical protein [Streptomyces sp. CNQ431]|uniref:hypothetical protein n=1 Tax=Streptomyces sp. CNQ431 TaxID=1571532 RepID=UPI00053ED4EF|nr:hypothetical protein [Streptomyces sp. CNQ431]
MTASLPLTPAAHADLPRDESYWDGLINVVATAHSVPARASATDTYVYGWVHDLGTTVTAVLRPRAELQRDDHLEAAPARPKLLAPR